VTDQPASAAAAPAPSQHQPAIDLHAHMMPRGLWSAADEGRAWRGATYERDAEGRGWLVVGGVRSGPDPARLRSTPEDRIRDMDAAGTDVQVVSMTPLLIDDSLDTDVAVRAAREVNDEIADWTRAFPTRLRGLATLPLTDVAAAIAELERAVGVLGLAGAEVDTRVGDRAWDDPAFEPLFAAAEQLGAILFFHPSYSLVWGRITRYHLGNTIGNPAEDLLAAAALIFGGVLDRHPDLKVVIAHGGGPLPFGIGRMDRGWQVRRIARTGLLHPPSRDLRGLYVDCITWSEPALRFLVDTMGADRVVLGSDWPYDMGLEEPARWIRGMTSLTDDEKRLILGVNAARLLASGGSR